MASAALHRPPTRRLISVGFYQPLGGTVKEIAVWVQEDCRVLVSRSEPTAMGRRKVGQACFLGEEALITAERDGSYS